MKKSDVITLDELSSEVVAMWRFDPYEFHTRAPSIERFSTIIEVECKNCNHTIVGTFHELEVLHEKGYYCPECMGSFNPVYHEQTPANLAETDPAYIPDLAAEYMIMGRIREEYGYQPYRFQSLNAGKSVRLEHACCSSVFSATGSMLFKNREIADHYNGEPLKLPYCPKCNEIINRDNVNYGGARFIERLDTQFKNIGVPFPYVFSEEDIYRFKSYDFKLIVTCKYCNKKFPAIPNDLFRTDGLSLCPYCHGKEVSEDSADNSIQQLETDMIEEKVIERTAPEPIIEETTSESTNPLPDEEQAVEDESISSIEESNQVIDQNEFVEEIPEESVSSIPEEDVLFNADESVHDELYAEDVISQPEVSVEGVSTAQEFASEVPIQSISIDSLILPDMEAIDESTDIDNQLSQIDESCITEIADEHLDEGMHNGVVNESFDVRALDHIPGLSPSEKDQIASQGFISLGDEQVHAEETQVDDLMVPASLTQGVQFEGDYPLEYEPTEVDIPPPDFANPPIVSNEYDTPQVEPAEESYSDFVDSMSDVMTDMGIEPVQDTIEETSVESSEEYLSEPDETYDDESEELLDEEQYSDEVMTPVIDQRAAGSFQEDPMSFLGFGKHKRDETIPAPSMTQESLPADNETGNQVDIISSANNPEVYGSGDDDYSDDDMFRDLSTASHT